MPTLEQLPQAVATQDEDLLLIGQNGQTCVTNVGILLDPVQRKLTLTPGTLLGRSSPLLGGPEALGVGAGLRLTQSALEVDQAVVAGVDSPSFLGRPTAPTLPDDDDSDALATTSFVQRHTSKATPVQAVAGKTGFVTLTATDIGGLATVARTGAYADIAGRPAADQLNVLDFGALGDGVTHAGTALNAAMAAANALASGGEVLLPAGTYRINMQQGNLLARSNVTLRGAGRGKTVIVIDDLTVGPGRFGLSNQISDGSFPKLSKFSMRDLTIRGMRLQGMQVQGSNLTVYASKTALVNCYNVEDIAIEDCEFLDSTAFSLVIGGGTNVSIRGNRVARSTADSIATWDVSGAVITDNRIEMSGDDSISCHTNDATTAVPRSGLVIANNNISDGPGIHVLGAKVVTIEGNVIRRAWGAGIKFGFDPFHAQGDTPNFAVNIINNIITDVFSASGWNPFASTISYIRVGGSSRQAGSGASAPGTPVVGTGAVTPLYGSGRGNFYSNAQFNTSGGTSTPARTVASPGGAWLRIEGNTLARTLPSVAAWSDWGYGDALEAGVYGGYLGGVTETMLASIGITVLGAMANARIAGNLIQTSGQYAILFDAGTADADFDDLLLQDNTLADFTLGGIWFARTGTPANTRIHLRDNVFNGDPFFRHTARAAGGTWANGTGLVGVNAPWINGLEVERNHFLNLATAMTAPGSAAVAHNARLNVVHCNPVAVGYAAGNAGVGNVPAASSGWTHTIEGCDPAASNYGDLLGQTLISAAAMPTSGRFVAGHFVQNSAATPAAGYVASKAPVLRGWLRLTTGAAHELGVDWEADWSAPMDGTSVILPSGGTLDMRGGDGAVSAFWNTADPSFNVSATGGANGGALLRLGFDGSLRAGGNLIATQSWASGQFASPPALGNGTPSTGAFTILTAGGSTTNVAMGGDSNGNISLGRLSTATTPYIDFRGNNIVGAFSTRLVSDAPNRLSVVASGTDATLRVAGTILATAVSIGGVQAATQSWVTGLGYELAANKGVANGYASLDATGKIPTSLLPSAVVGAMNYQGTWNAATNTPTLVSSVGTKGFFYTVAVAGSTTLDGLTGWQVGDHVAFNGSKWQSFDGTASEVISVAGRTGTVTLGTADIVGLGSIASQSAAAVAVTGGSLSGLSTLALANPNGSGVTEGVAYSISAPAARARQVFLQTSGSNRWSYGASGAAETGSNAGSDFALARYADNGSFIDNVLSVNRATGTIAVGNAGLTLSGSQAASQAWVAAQNFEQPSRRGQPNGYAALDAAGQVPTSQLPAAVLGALNYQGVWDAAANVPALASGTGTKGFYYTIGTGGTTTLDGTSLWEPGDQVAFNGVAWQKFDGPTALRPRITVFTANGTFTRRSTATSLAVLVIGGGGGGGRGAALPAGGTGSGGGGGGGGAVNVIGPVPATGLPANLSVTVGAGGTGGSSTTPDGGQGGNSAVTGAGVAWFAYGGGGGARGSVSGASGGGGGACFVNAGASSTSGTGGNGGAPFGAAGGSGAGGGHGLYPSCGSGGGGCSALGAPANSGSASSGGSGGGAGGGFNTGTAAPNSGVSGPSIWSNASANNGNPGFNPASGAGSGGGGGLASASANGQAGGTGGRAAGGGGGAAALSGFTPGTGGNGGAGQVVFIEW